MYHTETEQIEHIKKWFQRHGKLIISVVLIVLMVVLGYRVWINREIKAESQASMRYERLMLGVANQDSGLVNAQANDLIEHYPKTIYAQAALLMQAKLALEYGDNARALEKLNQVMTKSSDSAFRQIARLRSARILESEGEYQKALSILKTVDNSAYLPLIEEVKGDLYLGLMQPKTARDYYQKAMEAFPKAGLYSPLLEMKLNELAG